MFHALGITFKLFVCELFRGRFIDVSLFLCYVVDEMYIFFAFRELADRICHFMKKCG